MFRAEPITFTNLYMKYTVWGSITTVKIHEFQFLTQLHILRSSESKQPSPPKGWSVCIFMWSVQLGSHEKCKTEIIYLRYEEQKNDEQMQRKLLQQNRLIRGDSIYYRFNIFFLHLLLLTMMDWIKTIISNSVIWYLRYLI